MNNNEIVSDGLSTSQITTHLLVQPTKDEIISRLQEKIDKLEKNEILYQKMLSGFTVSQKKLLLGENVEKYDEEIKETAINILGATSNEVYEYIRKKFPLPSSSTVLKWISPVVNTDGPIQSVVEAIKSDPPGSADIHGQLVMDETAISSGFRFDPSGYFIAGSISNEFINDKNQNIPASKALLYIFK